MLKLIIFVLWFGLSGSVIGSIVLPHSFNTIGKTIIMQEEIWKDIPHYQGKYQVSNFGRIKSLNFRQSGKEKLMKVNKNVGGYYCLRLTLNGVCKTEVLHKLIAITFLNHVPCGHTEHVDHIDNNKDNNAVSNLQLISCRENSSKDRKGLSKYVGVHWSKSKDKWASTIRNGKKRLHLGYFDNEYEAHLAYQNALKEIELYNG